MVPKSRGWRAQQAAWPTSESRSTPKLSPPCWQIVWRENHEFSNDDWHRVQERWCRVSAAQAPSGAPTSVAETPRRILLVDDDELQLKLCGLRLRQAGFEVDTARGAAEAWEKIGQRRPDAILSDVLMGDVDGFEFCR